MPFREVHYRLVKTGKQQLSRLTRKSRMQRYRREAVGKFEIPIKLQQIRFYGINGLTLSMITDSWKKNILSRADRYLAGEYECITEKRINMPYPFQWNYEPKRKIRTPLIFSYDIDYRDTARYGDFKYFWEMGRWGHLVTLSKAYYITRDVKYARMVECQIKEFIEQCPYLLGIHWTMAMENSLRLISLCWIANFMYDYLEQAHSLCCYLEEVIQSHLDYIVSNYSLYSSGNNHYISEVAGVFLATLCFGYTKKHNHYKNQAFSILCSEIEKQYYSDGVNKEQASHYHISCIYCFILAGLLGQQNGMPFPREYWDRIEKAAEYIYWISNSVGKIPKIGDSDDGKTVHLSDDEVSISESLLATCAVMFERGDFKSKTAVFDEMSFWLLGSAGCEKYKKLQPEIRQDIMAGFKQGGYYIIDKKEKPEIKMIIDCGPLGMGTLAGHGHADMLSFLLQIDGQDVFIDPGTYIYHSSSPFRNYFRKTLSHNTITVDDCDQSEIAGPFLWGFKANAILEEWRQNSDCIIFKGSHDGYKRLLDPLLHRREIILNKKDNKIIINDNLECSGNHSIKMCLHISDMCQLESFDLNVWKIMTPDHELLLEFESGLDIKVVSGQNNPPIGWKSDSYDHKQAIYTIMAEKLINKNSLICTQIKFIS